MSHEVFIDTFILAKIEVSIKNFNFDLLITLIHNFLISLDSVDL